MILTLGSWSSGWHRILSTSAARSYKFAAHVVEPVRTSVVAPSLRQSTVTSNVIDIDDVEVNHLGEEL